MRQLRCSRYILGRGNSTLWQRGRLDITILLVGNTLVGSSVALHYVLDRLLQLLVGALYLIHLLLVRLRVLLQLTILSLLRVADIAAQILYAPLQLRAFFLQTSYLRRLHLPNLTISCFFWSDYITRRIAWFIELSYKFLYAFVWFRYSSLTVTSSSPLCRQSIVICRMISSKHWSNSSSRTGHSPISLACRCSSRRSSSWWSWITYIFVAGVESTVCTQNCPLSVLCSLGGRITPRMSSVWWTSSSRLALRLLVLPAPLTSTGVEYLTNDPCSISMLTL